MNQFPQAKLEWPFLVLVFGGLHTSPRLGVRFDLSSGDLRVLRPDGRPLASYVELAEENERQRQRAEQERQRAEQERQRAEQERQRNDRLTAQLRALGLEPQA